jgi:mannose-6-phosphate isomerase class I
LSAYWRPLLCNEVKVMEVKTLRSNTLVYDDRLVNQSLVTIKLTRLVDNLKINLLESGNNLHSIVLLNRKEKKIVLMAMNEAVELESIQADGSVTIQLIEGKARFQAGKQLVVLAEGQLLKVSEKTTYSITAMEEAVIMLTIAS